MAALDDLGLALLADMHGDALKARSTRSTRVPECRITPDSVQAVDDDAAGFRILMGEKGGGIDDGDMGAEHAVSLRDLEADGTAAEHDQMLDPLVHIEDRLVGE